MIPKDPDTPNVLFVCCDHLRSDWLACNSQPIVMMPQVGCGIVDSRQGQSGQSQNRPGGDTDWQINLATRVQHGGSCSRSA